MVPSHNVTKYCYGGLITINTWGMVVFTAFSFSAAHSCIIVCCMQTFDLVMPLLWAADSQGGSAPSATQTLKDNVIQMESTGVVPQGTVWPQNVWTWRYQAGKYILLISPHIFIKQLLQKKTFFPQYILSLLCSEWCPWGGKSNEPVIYFLLSMPMTSMWCIWAVQFRKQPYMHLFVAILVGFVESIGASTDVPAEI